MTQIPNRAVEWERVNRAHEQDRANRAAERRALEAGYIGTYTGGGGHVTGSKSIRRGPSPVDVWIS